MVVTCSNTEVSLLTTTAQSNIVVLAPTRLFHGIYPVSIVVIHLILREFTTRLVVDFVDIGTGTSLQVRIEIFLFQHHGVLVTIEEVHAFRLVGAGQTEAIGHSGLTTDTAFGLDLDNTISTL